MEAGDREEEMTYAREANTGRPVSEFEQANEWRTYRDSSLAKAMAKGEPTAANWSLLALTELGEDENALWTRQQKMRASFGILTTIEVNQTFLLLTEAHTVSSKVGHDEGA